MIAYAGIGSRSITIEEEVIIEKLGKYLNKRKFVLYSGNATGSDIQFQKGSQGNCMIMVPWKNYNKDIYDYENSLKWFMYDYNKDINAYKTIKYFHPHPTHLSRGSKILMGRNYRIIAGYDENPTVSFVICCADRDEDGHIKGGTGQACRIAENKSIPIINIRYEGWKKQLRGVIKDCEN